MSECAEAGGDPRGVRDAALVGVASHALLRVSEVSRLDVEDVSRQRDGTALLKIRRSKTDQYGEGAILLSSRTATPARLPCRPPRHGPSPPAMESPQRCITARRFSSRSSRA